MGRISNYEASKNKQEKEKQDSAEKEEATLAGAWKKLGRESLSAAEMAALVADVRSSRLPEGSAPITRTEKGGGRERFRDICSASKGLLSEDDFRTGPRKAYQFGPEYNALLLILMASDCFNEKRNKNRVSTRMERNRQLLDGIKAYLDDDEETSNLLNSHPTYYTAKLEDCLSRKINNELSQLTKYLYHMDSTVRYRFMYTFLSTIEKFKRELQWEDIKISSARLAYAHELDQTKDCDIQKAFFEAATLEQLLIVLIAYKKRGGKLFYVSESEELSPPGVALANELFEFEKVSPTIQDILSAFQSETESQTRYKEITNGIKQVLNMDDPAEEQLFRRLDSMIKVQYLQPYVSSEEYNKMIRFTESNIAENKYVMLNKYSQLGRNAYIKEQLEALRQATGQSNKNRKNEK